MLKDIIVVVDKAEAAAPFIRTVGKLAVELAVEVEVVALTTNAMLIPSLTPFTPRYVLSETLLDKEIANVTELAQLLEENGCVARVSGLHDDVAWLAGDLKRARPVADLFVIGERESWDSSWLRRHVIETLIRSGGTPLLLLPSTSNLRTINHAVLGWQASAEATRAMHALVTLAAPKAQIDVVTVGRTAVSCERDRQGVDHVERHLRLHGFSVATREIVEDTTVQAEVLLHHAETSGADVLAIGGFAHSRVRDIVLGGVTRDMIEVARTPILIVG